jgi:hypothetical protein
VENVRYHLAYDNNANMEVRTLYHSHKLHVIEVFYLLEYHFMLSAESELMFQRNMLHPHAH